MNSPGLMTIPVNMALFTSVYVEMSSANGANLINLPIKCNYQHVQMNMGINFNIYTNIVILMSK